MLQDYCKETICKMAKKIFLFFWAMSWIDDLLAVVKKISLAPNLEMLGQEGYSWE